jgi:hypothetical protein
MANWYAVAFPTYQPAMRNILSITNAFPALITTTYDGINPGNHNYETGLIVRLYIPKGWGMPIGRRDVYNITVTSPTQFTVNLDTTLLEPFVIPAYNPGHYGTPPVVVPVGEDNDTLYQATQNVLPYTTP